MRNAIAQWMFDNLVMIVSCGLLIRGLMILEFLWMIRRNGRLRRGVCLSQYPLPGEILHILRALDRETRVRTWRIFRVNHEVLFLRRDFSQIFYLWYFPYVGYIDLTQPQPILECRTPLSNMVTWCMLLSVALGVSVFIPHLLPSSLNPTMRSVVLLLAFGTMAFNLFMLFAAHRDELRKLRKMAVEARGL